MTGRSRTRRYLLTQQGYYPGVVAKNYDVWDWSTLNAGTLFQDSAKTTPVTANSDPVGAWVDGVSGVDAVQATTANKPTYTTASLNGLPTLSFDGGDILATANISISTFAVWVVARRTAGSISANLIIYEHSINAGSNDGMLQLWQAVPESIYVRRGGVSSTKDATAITADSVWRVLRHEHNGTHASHLVYYNGTNAITGSGTANDVGSGNANAGLFIGGRSGLSSPTIGNIAHLCIVSPYPTAQIIAQMESYINGIWGIY